MPHAADPRFQAAQAEGSNADFGLGANAEPCAHGSSFERRLHIGHDQQAGSVQLLALSHFSKGPAPFAFRLCRRWPTDSCVTRQPPLQDLP